MMTGLRWLGMNYYYYYIIIIIINFIMKNFEAIANIFSWLPNLIFSYDNESKV